jgi:hypothetical protein
VVLGCFVLGRCRCGTPASVKPVAENFHTLSVQFLSATDESSWVKFAGHDRER